VRIKVVKTNVNLLEAETNRALKEFEADNKVVIDTQILRAHPTGDLILAVIKYVEDEERISINDLSDIEEHEEYHSVIKGSKSGKVW
jgi:hypothetical protein